MNKLKSYNNFINEGVRDMMIPKSVEDMMSIIDKNPKNIINVFDSAGIDSDSLFSVLLESLSLEKVIEVFLNYISDNKIKLTSDKNISSRDRDIHYHLKELIYLMNSDDVWDDLTIKLYQEMDDNQMKKIINKLLLDYE